jgi:CHAT domain-containing protein
MESLNSPKFKSLKRNSFIRLWLVAITINAFGCNPCVARTCLKDNIDSGRAIGDYPKLKTGASESIDSKFNRQDSSKTKAVFNLAKSAYYLNDYNTSIALHLKFIDLVNQSDSTNYHFFELLTSYSQLADIFFIKNDFVNSISYNKLAVKLIYKESLPQSDYCFYFYRIARSFYALSDFTNSLIYYLECEKLNNLTIGSELTEDGAVIKNNIGLCYLKLGQKNASIKNFTEALRIHQNINSPREKGKVLNNIALVYQENHDYEKSLAYYNQSIEFYQSVGDIENVATVLNNIGNLYFSRKEYKSSIDYFLLALNSPLNKNQNISRNIAYRNNLSLAYLNLGMIDSAYFHNSLCQEYFKSVSMDSIRFILSDYFNTSTDRIEINLVNYNLTNDSHHLYDSYEVFITTIYCLLNSLDEDFNLLYTNPFLQIHKRFFDKSMQSAMLLDKVSPNKVLRTATISEIYKTLSLLNFENELDLFNDDLKIEIQCQQTTNSFNFVNDFLDSKNKASPTESINIDSLIIENHSDQNSKLENQVVLKNNIIQYFKNINSYIFAKIQQRRSETYLDYYVASDDIYIHSYFHNNLKLNYFKTKINLDSTVTRYTHAIKSLNSPVVDSIGTLLGELLINPFMPEIISKELIIIPDDLTSTIPFDILRYRPNAKETDFLINLIGIHYSLSFLDRNFSGKKHIKNYKSDFCGFAPTFSNNRLLKIPNSVEETIRIASFFKERNYNSQSFSGDSITLKNLFENGIDSRIFHISTHSVINDTLLSLNRLALSEDEGSLFLPVLNKIPFRNELLVLSSCETLADLSHSGEGNISFLKSFSHSNTAYILGTLWRVYDLPTKDFNELFYRNICNGAPPTEALVQAKRQFISSQNYQNPIFWAPFQLYENKN